MKTSSIIAFGIGLSAAVGYYLYTHPAQQPAAPTNPTAPAVGLANPASVFCINNGGTLIPMHNEQGDFAFCKLPGVEKQCEEWSLFRGECEVVGISTHAHYKADGKNIQVIYHPKQGDAILNAPSLTLEGITLKVAQSGSGARYINDDGTIEIWEHQGELTVIKDGEQLFKGNLSE